MKTIKEGSSSLLTAVVELVVGILLLINPVGFTSGIIVGLGVLLIGAGLLSTAQYFLAKPQEAALHQGLSRGLVLIIVGVLCAAGSERFVAMFPLLTMLYGILLLILSAGKVQIAVDMLRLKRQNWIFAVVSALVSIVMAALMLLNPFETTAVVWTLISLSLIAEAVLDVLAVFFKKKQAVRT